MSLDCQAVSLPALGFHCGLFPPRPSSSCHHLLVSELTVSGLERGLQLFFAKESYERKVSFIFSDFSVTSMFNFSNKGEKNFTKICYCPHVPIWIDQVCKIHPHSRVCTCVCVYCGSAFLVAVCMYE